MAMAVIMRQASWLLGLRFPREVQTKVEDLSFEGLNYSVPRWMGHSICWRTHKPPHFPSECTHQLLREDISNSLILHRDNCATLLSPKDIGTTQETSVLPEEETTHCFLSHLPSLRVLEILDLMWWSRHVSCVTPDVSVLPFRNHVAHSRHPWSLITTNQRAMETLTHGHSTRFWWLLHPTPIPHPFSWTLLKRIFYIKRYSCSSLSEW